uniref:valine--tRNA ligase, mitochondrial-like isoform X2 n=1 Tax=Myxine glutinosa TaxID=7769 RepID=UPI00358E6D4B
MKNEDFTLQQDEDVLDTWFSSALFPFAALGWPRQTKDLEAFYPNTMLETGHDLIFFWVARMVMLGQQLTGKLPFRTVLFHPMVRGSHGKKMSKSLGNAIDPLDVISGISLQDIQSKLLEGNLTESELCISHELQKKQFPNGIPECGTDALRFAFCSLHLKGDDVSFDVATVLNFRHFCNKIWNALKFTLAALGNDFEPQPLESPDRFGVMDQWMLSRLFVVTRKADSGFRELDLASVTGALHHFWLQDFCRTYLETVKSVLRFGNAAEQHMVRQTLYHCTELGLRLIAPFMPFLAEELWQRLPVYCRPESICIASYPSPALLQPFEDLDLAREFEMVQEVIRTVLGLKANYNITRSKPKLLLECSEDVWLRAMHRFSNALHSLACCEQVKLMEPGQAAPAEAAVAIVAPGCKAFLLHDLVDIQQEITRLTNLGRQIEDKLQAMKHRTANPSYSTKVSDAVRARHATKISILQEELKATEQAKQLLKSQDLKRK